MIGEDRREEIERSIDNLRYDREVLRELYHQVDGIVPEKNLSDIIFEIHLTELKIETLRKQLPPPMSQRQLRALEEIPKAWAEVTGKTVGKEFALPDEARKLMDEANEVLNSDERHVYRSELAVAERKLNEAHKIIKQGLDKEREEALCEAADKTLQEYGDIAAGRDLESTAKRLKEVREKHGTPYGTVEAPRRTGRTFRNWLCNYFK